MSKLPAAAVLIQRARRQARAPASAGGLPRHTLRPSAAAQRIWRPRAANGAS